MTNEERAKHDAINSAWREQRNANRIDWRPSPSRDPAERRRDRDALNDAIRRAGGHQPQHDNEGNHDER